MATSEQLIASTVRHSVYLERLKSGEVNQFAAFLKRIDADIRKRLSGRELTEFSRARLEVTLKAVGASLATVFDEHYEELAGHLIELGEYESEFESRNLSSVLVNAQAAIPAAAQVRAAIFSAPLSVTGVSGGALLEPFIRDLKTSEIKRITGAIRSGFFQGHTNAQITRSIRGTKANKYRDGILNSTQRNASSIVRTAVQHVANTARAETWSENSDIVAGYRWVATLDSRTTQICAGLDGRVFEVGRGPVPPAHINCRSAAVAELSGKYAQLRDSSTRASTGAKGGQPVDASETYYSWLKRQPPAFQADAIGPVRAKLLRDGGLSSERFSRLNLGRDFQPLTLAEMRLKEPNAFERAAI